MDKKTQYSLAIPKTVRGYSSPMALNRETGEVIYPAKSVVAIRKLDDFASCRIFSKHTGQVVCVGIDQVNKRVASIEENGCLYIWDAKTLEVKAKVEHAYQGTVYDIVFESPDTNLIFICGNWKAALAKVMDYTQPSKTVGACSHLSKPVLSGVAKREGNITKFFAGGEDAALKLFEGKPNIDYARDLFSIKNQKFISMTRLSPDGTKILVVTMDKSIILVDPTTGDKQDIAVDKGPDNHTLAIISVFWIDDDKFITSSLDKTIKIWSLSEKKVLNTIKVCEKPTVDDMMCNAISDGKTICALTLNGKFNLWNMEGSELKEPDKIYWGHMGAITKVIHLPEMNKVITACGDGKILLWDLEKFEQTVLRQYNDCSIKLMELSKDKKFLYFIPRNGILTCIDLTSEETMKKDLFTAKDNGDLLKFVPSAKDPNVIYGMLREYICVIEKGVRKEKQKLGFDASSMDILEENNEIIIGDRKGKTHIFDLATLKEKSKIEGQYISEISMIKASPDEKYFVISENQSRIGIYRSDTKEEITYYKDHSSKGADCFFTEDGTKIVSCSVSGGVIIYSITDKKTLMNEFADGNYLNSICPYGPDSFICAGEKCVITKFKY